MVKTESKKTNADLPVKDPWIPTIILRLVHRDDLTSRFNLSPVADALEKTSPIINTNYLTLGTYLMYGVHIKNHITLERSGGLQH